MTLHLILKALKKTLQIVGRCFFLTYSHGLIIIISFTEDLLKINYNFMMG